MTHQASPDNPRVALAVIAMIGWLACVTGGYLGFNVHWTLYTLMPIGALITAKIAWRMSRV